jgi:uncharacterized protein YgbK (DUF1537 family)
VTLQCLLIADDLTGACDAAAQFALRGLSVRVLLDSEAAVHMPDVLAVSTESRDAAADLFRQALDRSLLRLPALRPRILFKKIDSTLRGNVGSEAAATLAALACDVAVVTPAFPALGRTVEAGYLRIAGQPDFVPVELAACFRGSGACRSASALPGALQCAIAGGALFVLADAASDRDLDAIVREGLALRQRVLWVGSAGLAAALARTMGTESPARPVRRAAPALFCLGSDHAVTREQQHRLIDHRAATLLPADAATPEAIRGALDQGRPVLLRIQRGHTTAARIRELVAGAPSPLVLSGGDTAALVCRALCVQAIELRLEVAPGIPCGLILGGPFDGLPVVTKSGGFGGPDALIEVADFFLCPPPLH